MKDSRRLRFASILGMGGLAGAVAVLAGCSKKEADSANAVDAQSTVLSTPADAGIKIGPIPSASVAALVNPDHLPVYDGPTGSIEGRVTVIGDPSPTITANFSKCPGAEKAYAKAFREGAPLPDGSRPLGDALVAVTGYAGAFIPEKNDGKTVTIEECAFNQRTVDLTFGQHLDIVNKTQGQLFAPELANYAMPALMVAPFGGEPVTLWPHKPGFTQVNDKFGHDYLVLDVYTMFQPLHTVSKLDGTYRIDGIPLGKLDVHARLRAINNDVTKSVEIRANVVEHVDLTMEYHAKPDGGAATATSDAGTIRIK